jgi:arylsulfatase A-like enzyme
VERSVRLGLASAFSVLVLACGGGTEPVPAEPVETRAHPRPNVVLLVADDLGYADLSVQGATELTTTNIDRLAVDGVRLTNNYANHPVCSPSRAALMTGKYQHRFGFENNPPRQGPNAGVGVPVTETMLAERLKSAGYATGMIGKWHIGAAPEKVPTARGFDTFYGFLGGAMAYTPDGASGAKTVLRGSTEEPMPPHTTEAFASEAESFIDANKDRPFFLYVAFNAVHAPLQSTTSYLERFADVEDPDRRAFLAMVSALDDAVGKIVAAIDRNGLGENTLIVFTSDNGGPTWQTTASNAPLNGVKATTLEGGIRVPAIFRWTGTVPAGEVVSSMTMGFDITTTAQAVAGVPLGPDQDGVDLMPYLTGAATGDAHEKLYWRSNTQGAMREAEWKLVKVADDWYLFDLDRDLGERHDLAATDPDRLAAMKSDWQAWSASMSEPAWERVPTTGTREEVTARLRELIRGYIDGKLTVDPRTVLYGGGPE